MRVTEVARWPDFLLYVTRMIPPDSAVAGLAAAGLVAERWVRRDDAGALFISDMNSGGKGLKLYDTRRNPTRHGADLFVYIHNWIPLLA